MPKNILLTALAAMLALVLIGCETDPPPAPKPLTRPSIEPPKLPPELAGTIAEHAMIVDQTYWRVEGYGLVIGLGKNGSSEVPAGLGAYFDKYLRRLNLGSYIHGTHDISPMMILRSLDTAIVRVTGLIPPGMAKGGRFDLEVQSLPETQTKSLEGGILMPAELFIYREGVASINTGAPVAAMGGGPVFVNPYIDHNKPAEIVKCRDGRIIGGGESSVARPVRLLLYQPDHAKCERIAGRINERFGRGDIYAKGIDSGLLDLKVPPQYADDVSHFAALVLHTAMGGKGPMGEEMARHAADLMESPQARYEDLSLVFESMGRQYENIIRAGYTSKNPSAAFFSARAGLRLEDETAADVVLKTASTTGPLQVQAIEELGRHRRILKAAPVLRELLDSEDNDVRLAAYNALLKRHDPAITSATIDSQGGKFKVDLVPARKYIVYVSQTDEPRIAIFGKNMTLRQPLFFNSDNDLVTMKADDGDRQLLIYRKILGTDRKSEDIRTDFQVASMVTTMASKADPGLDGKCRGLGLTYGQMVTTLQYLCKEGHVPAKFVLQPLTASNAPAGESTGIGRPDIAGD